MPRRNRLLRLFTVLVIAIATGQAVESLRADRTLATAASAPTELPTLAGITPVAAAAERPQDPCAPRLDLGLAPEAMIDVALSAPCRVGERVLLRHSGLSFTGQVGVDGKLHVVLPAMEEAALVAAYFDGSAVALQAITVPDASRHMRFAFQAAHPVQFDIRVDDAGAVYSGRASGQTVGPIMTLGSAGVREPMLAQVYSFPESDFAKVKLTVELRITAETCSRSFVAETLLSQGGVVRQKPLPVTVPLCGTAGDILVLKNLITPLTLAVPE